MESIAWSPTTNLSAIAYTGAATNSATATATTSTAEKITLTVKDDGGCTSTKSVTITITAPTAPIAAGKTICANTTATLSATGSNGSTFKWYSSETDMTILASTAVFTTPNLTSNKSYWVSQTFNNCESPRTKVDVIISSPQLPTFDAGRLP